jgi:hypothetical protein
MQVAVTMNRMRCKQADEKALTSVRVRELRERLGIAPFDPASRTEKTICVDNPKNKQKSRQVCRQSVSELFARLLIELESKGRAGEQNRY